MEKVVIFIPTLTAGGAERVACILANYWSEIRHVTLITYFGEDSFYRLSEKVEHVCLGYKSRRTKLQRTNDIARAIWRFRAIVREIKPRFVLSFMNKYNVFVLASLYNSDIPVIISERDSPQEILPKIRVHLRNLLYPTATGLICQTLAFQKFINRATNVRSSITIPNPVSRLIEPSERNGREIILAVGRLVEKKGFDHLLHAFAGMKNSTWRLEICGDGPLRQTLETLSEKLAIADKVTFAGLVSDLSPYFKRAGIFAFTSLFEGFPNSLAEAFVSGIPCISYDCSTGPSEIITNGETGVLIDVGDWRTFAENLDNLANSEKKRQQYATNAIDAGLKFSAATIAGQYLAYCDEVSR